MNKQVDLLAANGWSDCVSSCLHCTCTSDFPVFMQSINGGVGGRLLNVEAEDLKVLGSTCDLESSVCCFSISWPKMSIS